MTPPPGHGDPVGWADSIRIMLGKLTPAEIEERDAIVRARRDRQAAEEASEAAQHREDDLHQQRLVRAAGIATIELHCHQDTWQWLVNFMEGDRGSYSAPWWPTDYENRITHKPDHMLAILLSGPQAAEVLTRIRRLAQLSDDAIKPDLSAVAAKRAVARRIYQAFSLVIDQIVLDTSNGTPVPPVVLDDRPDPQRS